MQCYNNAYNKNLKQVNRKIYIYMFHDSIS